MTPSTESSLFRVAESVMPGFKSDLRALDYLLPKLARDVSAVSRIRKDLADLSTDHQFILRDSRELSMIPDESVHLIPPSPPYWSLKRYTSADGQLGHIADYEQFLSELDKVWTHCHRILVRGGRLVTVVGDVCLSRKRFQRHVVFPLHASIQERCRKIGFDNLAPIIWHKIANAKYEVEGGGGFLGKPFEPNAIVKNDIEYILMQRKSGGYRKPTPAARLLSVLSVDEHRAWFRQVWNLAGASTREHPAPFPVPLAERLVRMFSFVGDIVLDPFAGSGTTNLACLLSSRNSIGFDIEPKYLELGKARLAQARLSRKKTTQLAIDEESLIKYTFTLD